LNYTGTDAAGPISFNSDRTGPQFTSLKQLLDKRHQGTRLRPRRGWKRGVAGGELPHHGGNYRSNKWPGRDG